MEKKIRVLASWMSLFVTRGEKYMHCTCKKESIGIPDRNFKVIHKIKFTYKLIYRENTNFYLHIVF